MEAGPDTPFANVVIELPRHDPGHHQVLQKWRREWFSVEAGLGLHSLLVGN